MYFLRARNIEQAMKYLEPVWERLNKEQSEYLDNKIDEAYQIQKKNGLQSIWSIFNVNLEDEHPYSIGTKITIDGIDEEEMVTGKTYLNLWKDTDRLMTKYREELGDHVFIEGYNLKNNKIKVILGS
jgi:hypothetical protein